MAKVQGDTRLLPSVLSRLVGEAGSSDARSIPTQTVRELRESVRRDLQDLLNTRWYAGSLPEHLTELEVSLLNCGLPDALGSHFGTEEGQKEFCRLIEDCIRSFEPRLDNVRVSVVETKKESLERDLGLVIEAELCVKPVEAVIYNSVLDPATGSFEVRGGML